MRGGAHALKLLLAGVLVGVAAVALVGAASDALRQGAKAGALDAVGGDLSLRLFHTPPTTQHQSFFQNIAGASVSVTAELKPMATGSGEPLLVELKGVDGAYPLYGAVKLDPPGPLSESLKRENGLYGAVADPALFAALGVSVGDTVRVGKAEYRLNGVLAHEPDRAFRAFSLGPRMMVTLDSLPATGQAGAGAEVYYYTHIKLPTASNSAAVLSRIDQTFPNAGWRMVNAREGVPGIERTLAMAHVLLLFIGLGVMLVGGAGISGAVRAHVQAKLGVIAILKSIGTPPNVIALAMGFEVMAAAALGSGVGVVIGAFGPGLSVWALADQVPFDLSVIPAAKPLVAAVLFGTLTALLFAWWPLVSVTSVNARVLLRERFSHVPGRAGLGGWAGAVAIALAILAVVFWVSPIPIVSAVFLVGAFALAMFYAALGRGIARMAKVLARGRRSWLRMALGNLHRAGAPTGAVVMALGLTLTLLVALDGLGRAAESHVRQALPASAPDLVAFSLGHEQAQALSEGLEDWGGAETINVMPFIHARVQAINGVGVRDLNIPRSLSWVVRGDRGVSYAGDLPHGSTLTAGTWWSDANVPGLSLDADVAAQLNVSVGDEITLNVSGHVVTAPIRNLRAIDWTRLDLDFPILASPATLKSVPHTFAASLKAKPGRATQMETLIKTHFSDTPLIRISDVLASLSKGLDALVAGLNAAAWMCGVAALVVLAGSVLQGLTERTDEALLFKVLGARRGQILGQVTAEFLGLGVLVALAAVPIGLAVAHGVAAAAGLVGADIGVGGAVQLAIAAIAVTLGVGLLVTSGAYGAAPSAYLRSRGV